MAVESGGPTRTGGKQGSSTMKFEININEPLFKQCYFQNYHATKSILNSLIAVLIKI